MDQLIIAIFDQVIMLVGLLIGVIFSEAVLLKARTGAFVFPNLTKKDILVYFVIAIIITPIVFEKTLNLDPNLPFMVKLGLYIQTGVSYPIIFGNISPNGGTIQN